ncbi:acyl-CoA--sterol O-acyltransferase 1-like [Cornus florida]|uniref:acyl-CoA--sterol O-acyltransferase 1-like n=1 Tax=Cornus florida TaxID=4283 RepID=UPI00289FCCD7|nr:acyl-CoA--sterol O-acyltransferase 1-like [Cornus florida]
MLLYVVLIYNLRSHLYLSIVHHFHNLKRATMEGEINNLIVVCITVLASICYCYAIGKFITKGPPRLLAILPIVCLFFYLPFTLHSIHFGSSTSFFISWLANFKLLLFSFGKGPLSSHPPIPLSLFITIACLPIKIQNHQTIQKSHKSPLNYAIKVILLSAIMGVYGYREYVHPKFIMILYCFHIYLCLELMLATVGALVRALGRLELEPQFDEPYLSSSLQDFWGKRWNLMVTGILRPTVYDPVRSISTRLIGKKWGSLPAVLATFFVSAMMHELIFYNVGRVKPTWEVTCFFLIHGVCLAMEIVIKKAINGKFRLSPIVSGPLVLMFVLVTSIWLFIFPALRCDFDVRTRRETAAFVEFVKNLDKFVKFTSFKAISR